jgi:hypothetical protein
LGIGNKELYKVSNLSLVLECHFFLLPNESEGMSVMEFSSPAIWSGVIGHVPCNLSRSARALIMFANTSNPRVARRWTHPKVGELLLNRATFFSRRFPHTASMTSHRNSKPAILRSELDISYAWYLSLVTWGHSHLNTVGMHALFSPNTTPPMPCEEASHTPI